MSKRADDDDRMGRFMHDLAAATHPLHVAHRYSELYPDLSAEFHFIASTHNRLKAAAELGEQSPQLTDGDRLGEFRVVRFLSHGGMGEIYEAEQDGLFGRRVVLKVIRPGTAPPDAVTRFARERLALTRLHHTNIVPVLTSGRQGEVHYYAMPFIDGATLADVIHQLRKRSAGADPPDLTDAVRDILRAPRPSGPVVRGIGRRKVVRLHLRSVADTLAEVADAIHAAHQAGVVHRDLKPANLMLEPSGHCWVIDFGVADVRAPHPADADPCPAAAAPSTPLGTAAYMAPEQFDGGGDPRSDVWALGVTLFELLTGRRPFPGPDRDDYRRQVNTTTPDVRPLARRVPVDLSAICRKAMSRRPADRYPTAAALAADLRRWRRGEPTAANPPGVGRWVALWAGRHPGWAVASAVVLVAVGVAFWGERMRTRAARAEFASESARAAAAEREANRERRQRELLDLQREHLVLRTAGWRDRLWAIGGTLAAGGSEPELRDRLAALTAGLDARAEPVVDHAPATFLAFSPDGRRVLVAGHQELRRAGALRRDPLTRLLDRTTGTVRRFARGAVGPVGWREHRPVQLLPPTGDRPSFLLWDLDRDEMANEFALPAEHTAALAEVVDGVNLAGVVLATDTRTVAAFARGPGGKRAILIWSGVDPNPARGQVPTVLLPATDREEALAVSADGRLLAVGDSGGRVRVWAMTAAPPESVGTFDLGRSPITALAFGQGPHHPPAPQLRPAIPSGQWLAAGDASGTIGVWDVGRADRVMRTRGGAHEVFGLAFSPDGASLFSAGRGDGRCWAVATGRERLRLPVDRNWLPGLAVSPDGRAVAVTAVPRFGSVGGVSAYALEPDRGTAVLHGLTGPVCRVAITPDGRRAAALTQNWQVGVWEVATGDQLVGFDAPLAMYADHNDLRFTPDGRFLVVVGGTTAERWEVPPDRRPARRTDSWALPPAYSNRLAIAADGTILLGRTETRGRADIIAKTISPADDPRCVRVYELPPGAAAKELARHDDHAWRVIQLHAAPDGTAFVAEGLGTSDPASKAIIAYAGRRPEMVWRIPLPGATEDRLFGFDATGEFVTYQSLEPANRWRSVRAGERTGVTGGDHELPALVGKLSYLWVNRNTDGIHLAHPGQPATFLTLYGKDRVHNRQLTSDGRYLIWGQEDGTVIVCDLDRVGDQLRPLGLGWEKFR